MHKYDQMTEPELRKHFNDLCDKIKYHLPPDTGFIVLAAPFGASGIAQYASNVHRDDAERWMVETMARWDAGDHVERTGG